MPIANSQRLLGDLIAAFTAKVIDQRNTAVKVNQIAHKRDSQKRRANRAAEEHVLTRLRVPTNGPEHKDKIQCKGDTDDQLM